MNAGGRVGGILDGLVNYGVSAARKLGGALVAGGRGLFVGAR